MNEIFLLLLWLKLYSIWNVFVINEQDKWTPPPHTHWHVDSLFINNHKMTANKKNIWAAPTSLRYRRWRWVFQDWDSTNSTEFPAFSSQSTTVNGVWLPLAGGVYSCYFYCLNPLDLIDDFFPTHLDCNWNRTEKKFSIRKKNPTNDLVTWNFFF